MKAERVVISRRVVTPEGERDAAILIADGRILDVVEREQAPTDVERLDAGDCAVLPGFVDCHVHVNEPGRTEWEGFESATRAAAAGGITTIVDMPLNCIPVTTSLDALETKLASVQSLLHVDVGFWGGVVPGNAGELEAMVRRGVVGFKTFLVHSGIDEFPNTTEADLLEAMPVLARLGVPLLVHAELESHLRPPDGTDARSYASWLDSRPKESENAAIRLLVDLCRRTGCRVHVVHLSSADALGIVARAKGEGLPLTVETCPHYLTLSAHQVPEGQTQYKCAPPIREETNRLRLWEGLESGVIDCVVSDHSPCTPHLKHLDSGDFGAAWGGISSVQLGPSIVWTEARSRGHGLSQLCAWMSGRTAALAGLSHRKGAIAPGLDADLVFFDPDASYTVTASMLHHRHKLTPYLGRTLSGAVRRTLLRGATVFEDGRFDARRGRIVQGVLS